MQHRWLYINNNIGWWRCCTNPLPKGGKIFDLRNSNCYRCKLNCNIAIQYREHFYCEKCHNCLQSVNYNIIKFLRNREIHI